MILTKSFFSEKMVQNQENALLTLNAFTNSMDLGNGVLLFLKKATGVIRCAILIL